MYVNMDHDFFPVGCLITRTDCSYGSSLAVYSEIVILSIKPFVNFTKAELTMLDQHTSLHRNSTAKVILFTICLSVLD